MLINSLKSCLLYFVLLGLYFAVFYNHLAKASTKQTLNIAVASSLKNEIESLFNNITNIDLE